MQERMIRVTASRINSHVEQASLDYEIFENLARAISGQTFFRRNQNRLGRWQEQNLEWMTRSRACRRSGASRREGHDREDNERRF
jgi:hypothetical protein